ncbi:hypothetical protein, partial [Haemophilus haemolyticus]|uniref:hypothetical protein n=1 Tax=Haemophilus haemolyticus TaxID=726 RepID=UPI00129001E7
MELNRLLIVKFVKISFPFLSFPFLSFPFLSFPAYSQDSNSEENKPLPLNEEGYEARKKSITDNINKAVEDIKEKEKEVKYDFETEGRPNVNRDETHSVFSHYNTPTENVGYYLFEIGSGHSKVNNLKLVNNTNLSSRAEVFSSRHTPQETPGVNNLAYVENNGNITGLGKGRNEPAIYLYSKKDFYFKNSGKITSRAYAENIGEIRNGIFSNEVLVVENEGSGSMLNKFNFYGGHVTFSNKENALVYNYSISAGDTLIFSNKGTMGHLDVTPMTIDEFIKAGRGRYKKASEIDEIKKKYSKYEEEFYRDKFKKIREFIAAKDEYIAEKYGTEKSVPYKNYKEIIDEYDSRPKIDAYTPKAHIPVTLGNCYKYGGCDEDTVETEDLFNIDIDNFERSLPKSKTIDEFIKDCGKECDIKKEPTWETMNSYSDYTRNLINKKNSIETDKLRGENTGAISAPLDMTFKDGYFINSGSINDLSVSAAKGLIVNRGAIFKLSIRGNGEDSELLTVDLKNSYVFEDPSINRKSAETRVIVNEETKIDGVLKANGSDETLVVSRDKNSELHNLEAGMDKYDGFEKLEMQGKWAIKEHDATFKQSITFNHAEVELADKTLDSQEVKNLESSAINVTSKAGVKGNFTNQGTVRL